MDINLIGLIRAAVLNGTPLLFGTSGEILTEKSGNLNLGVEGIMAVGAIFGYIVGCYANSLLVGILISFAAAGLCGLLFAFLPDILLTSLIGSLRHSGFVGLLVQKDKVQ